MKQCNSNFEYQISKISNGQCNICRSCPKPVSNVIVRVYPCNFSCKLVYEIKLDAPITGHYVYKERWTSQKDDDSSILQERSIGYKHAIGIHKEDRLVRHGLRSNGLHVLRKLIMAKVKYFY